ncbi:type I restriction-modification system subunit M [Dietzia cinnamea]|uniref:type I restriction-modification system subunit M n=1 Tax=Dietzia cinnamea TaxID=321318 RepID=UPI00223A6DAC|nr:class I SAM-dependent DNA methyltransferase [Dietzia cinnamea]MCT2062219.1 type I restriction-modification system subunit M [Dietzia cinnamea]MCT2236601.1 type I restriction-modification system subunit M [Dietzia cinnamea]MCT2300103.1 type I restriction-modification system subunit M [Dietzia cinnamea]
MTEDEALALARRYAEPSVPITLSELENYLARAADLLRGSIDQADFKAYIFPLMFFKRISDVYVEEFADALAESGGDFDFAEFDENHRFIIPDGHSWQAVRERTENIGAALQAAFREIENANPDTLYGVFGSASWTNKEKLPDAKLSDLIEHFSSKTLSNAAVSPDVFGNAYEYLIKRFADQSNKKAGEYYTPRSVVGLLVSILDPREGESIYDPACGTGGMLIEVIKHVEETGGNAKTLLGKLYGQEKVLTTSAIAKMNLLLHGIDDFNIAKGDTLRDPAFFTGTRLAQFDCVVANPPFSLKKWGHEEWGDDKWGRNSLGGVPPKGYADWAWVQHMIKSAMPGTGRIAVVLPQGALFRQGAEAKIRSHVLKSHLVEAVIGLGPNLFYGTGLAACILVLRKNRAEEHRGQVLFINAENLFKRGRNQNFFEPEHAEAILSSYTNYVDVENLARVATLEEIKSNGDSLNIPLYVQTDIGQDELSLADALANLEAARRLAAQTRAELEAQLAKWGLAPDDIAKEVSA